MPAQLRRGPVKVRIPEGRRRCALDDPAVAVRVTEVGKLHSANVLDLTDIGATAQQLCARRSHIGYDELQPFEAARRASQYLRCST